MEPFDLFAEALCQFYEHGHALLRTEREDGFRGREDISWYFTDGREFPAHEKKALAFALGSVLDIGCGAGRHSLYLQRRGLNVIAVDVSPRLVNLARARGVKRVQVADACRRLPFSDGEFDTVVLFGNNLGICGTEPKFRRMLRELYRITSRRGRILATTRMPSTTNARDRAYLMQNIERGRALGQIRFRLAFGGKLGAWFDLLLLSPTDLLQIALREEWHLTDVIPFRSLEEGYAAVMEKEKRPGATTGR